MVRQFGFNKRFQLINTTRDIETWLGASNDVMKNSWLLLTQHDLEVLFVN